MTADPYLLGSAHPSSSASCDRPTRLDVLRLHPEFDIGWMAGERLEPDVLVKEALIEARRTETDTGEFVREPEASC